MIRLRSRDIACRDAVALMADYLDNALPARRRAMLERHLAGCPNCSAYLEQMRKTIAIAGRIRPEDVPDAAMDELLDVFRRYRDDPEADDH